MSPQIVTANRLSDGRVVFLTVAREWALEIAKADVLAGEALQEALTFSQAQAAARIVVEPYEIEVALEDGAPVPVRLRERIRAAGPTVAYGEAERALLAARQ